MMTTSKDRVAMRRIIVACEELREIATDANQEFIAHLLSMVVIQARKVQAGDGAVDGEI